jgi:hypothetical protein
MPTLPMYKDIYFDIDDEALKSYQASYNLDLPSNPISWWDKLGGKAIVLVLAAGAIWAYWGKGSDDEEEAPKEVTPGKIADQNKPSAR